MFTSDEDVRRFLDEAERDMPQFDRGVPHYNPDGNEIEVYWEDAHGYSESCGSVILHRGQADSRVVGVTIHGVRELVGESDWRRWEAHRNRELVSSLIELDGLALGALVVLAGEPPKTVTEAAKLGEVSIDQAAACLARLVEAEFMTTSIPTATFSCTEKGLKFAARPKEALAQEPAKGGDAE